MLGPVTIAGLDQSPLFVSDLDYTLLRSDGTLSEYSAATINRLLNDGLQFTFATARSFQSASHVTRSLRLRLPVITYGGTITMDPAQERPSDIRLLDNRVVRAICAAADNVPAAEPIFFTFEAGRDWIRWRPSYETNGVRSFLAARPDDRRLWPVGQWEELDGQFVFYVSIIGDRHTVQTLHESLRDDLVGCASFLGEQPGTAGEFWLEIHAADGTKAQAARRLADNLGISTIIAFGDNHNDVPLFTIADEGYAVANAVPELRAIATRTIGHNDDDAVARWLKDRFG